MAREGWASVLVVDDDPEVRASMTRALAAEGFAVDAAADGREALRKLGELPRPCVLVLDLQMPGMDGWAMLNALRQDDAHRGVRVIACGEQDDPAPSTAWAVLHKPFREDDLVRMVKWACDRQQPAAG